MSDNTARPTAEVTLLGRQYLFACSPGQERKLDRAARYLDRAMQGIHSQNSLLGTERVALMAALNIAHELLEALEERRSQEQDLSRLSEKLERALKGTVGATHLPAE